MQSSFGGMLGMFGEAALEPLREPFYKNCKNQ